LIQQHPITGIGPNTFEPQYRLEVPKHYWPPLEWLVAQPHNLYLALWLETGFLGAISFLALVVWWIRAVWRRSQTLPDIERDVCRASVVALVAILIHGLFDTPYFKNDLAMEFIFLLVLPWLRIQQIQK
jgi:O-antigen ligase